MSGDRQSLKSHDGRRRSRAVRRAVEHLEQRDLLALVVGPITATEDSLFTGKVATLAPGDIQGTPPSLTATVNWGDGTAAAVATVTTDVSGNYDVFSPKTYTKFGSFPVVVVVNGTGGSTVTAQGTATVADATLIPTPTTFTATVGKSFTGTVATFQDPDTTSTPTDFQATITWGAGLATTVGAVTGSNGRFAVSGPFTYTALGPETVNVQIVRIASNQTVSTTSSASVVQPALAVTGTTVAPTVGQPFTGTVATFIDSNAPGAVDDYSAIIDWGNGTTSGTVAAVPGAPGHFTVSGTNTYNAAGTYNVTVTVARASLNQTVSTSLAAGNETKAIVSGPTLTVNGTSLVKSVNGLVNDTVATFTDTDLPYKASDFTAVVNWGNNGSASAMTNGTVVSDGGGKYHVVASYIYTTSGFFTATVTVTRTASKQSASASTQIDVQPMLTSVLPVLTATAGEPFTGTLLTVTDSSGSTNPADFAATINWGDGHVSPATLVGTGTNGAGPTYSVIGTNTYASARPTPYPVTVTLTRVATKQVSTFSTQIQVYGFTGALSPSSAPGGVPFATNQNQPTFSGTAEPNALIRLFVRPAGQQVVLDLGETIASPSGLWKLTAIPLADGYYTVTGVVTPAAGPPSGTQPLPLSPGGTLVVDTSRPQLAGVTISPRKNQVTVVYHGGLSGINLAEALNRFNYVWAPPGLPPANPLFVSLASIPVAPGGPLSVTLTFGYYTRVHGKASSLRILPNTILNNAGTPVAVSTAPLLRPLPIPHGRQLAAVHVPSAKATHHHG
jgi:hypothetical protein